VAERKEAAQGFGVGIVKNTEKSFYESNIDLVRKLSPTTHPELQEIAVYSGARDRVKKQCGEH